MPPERRIMATKTNKKPTAAAKKLARKLRGRTDVTVYGWSYASLVAEAAGNFRFQEAYPACNRVEFLEDGHLRLLRCTFATLQNAIASGVVTITATESYAAIRAEVSS